MSRPLTDIFAAVKPELFYRQDQHESERKRVERIEANQKRIAEIQKRLKQLVPPQRRDPKTGQILPAPRPKAVQLEIGRLRWELRSITHPEEVKESSRRGHQKNRDKERIASRIYYLIHRDDILKQKREYVLRNYPEFLSHLRAYHKAHPEAYRRYRTRHAGELAARSREWRKRHPETVRTYNRGHYAAQQEWKGAHPDRVVVHRTRHRQRIRERELFETGLK